MRNQVMTQKIPHTKHHITSNLTPPLTNPNTLQQSTNLIKQLFYILLVRQKEHAVTAQVSCRTLHLHLLVTAVRPSSLQMMTSSSQDAGNKEPKSHGSLNVCLSPKRCKQSGAPQISSVRIVAVV